MMQLFQVLAAKVGKGSIAENCRYCNILRNTTRNGLVITAGLLQTPNPNCFVCKSGSVHFSCDTNVWTLDHFLKRILTEELGFQEPNILLDMTQVWEQGEGSDQAMYEVNRPKILSQLPGGGIQNGTIVTVEDFTQDLELSIHISHETNWPKKEGDEASTRTEEFPFVIKGGQSAAPKPKEDSKAGANKVEEDDDDDDVVVVVKRKHKSNGENGQSSSKRQKTDSKMPPQPDDALVITID